MCMQLVEIYSGCRCLYYQHAVDRCSRYGRPAHEIKRRTVLVGYSCTNHSASHETSESGGSPTKATSTTNAAASNQTLQAQERRTTQPLKADYQTRNTMLRPAWTRTVESALALDLDLEELVDDDNDSGTSPCDETVPKQSLEVHTLEKALSYYETGISDQKDEDSDDSLSDTESVISTTSSTTTVDIDAVEAVFNRLLVFRDLRFLWPQLIQKCRSRKRSIMNIERFIRRYAGDLAVLANKPESEGGSEQPSRQVQIEAGRFIRRARLNFAQRIVEAHHQDRQPGNEEDATEKGHSRQQFGVTQDEEDESDDDSSFASVYLVAECFLFDTDPILSMQANVKAFVSLPNPRSSLETLGGSIWRSISNVVDKVCLPPIPEGKKRASWTCKCGRQLHDDFQELRPGAVEELAIQLRNSNKLNDNEDELIYSDPVDDSKAAPQPSTTIRDILMQIRQYIQSIANAIKPFTSAHQSRNIQRDIELGLCPSASASTHARSDHNFILLCIPFLRWATKLHQPEVCRINSDQELFRVLRSYYASQRGGSAWTRLRKIKGVQFVMFEMYKSQLADVQACPSVPIPERRTEYAYEPMPADVIPPIGSNHLMHLLEHPEDAEVVPVLLKKIPKKLHAKLDACPIKGSSVGWGLQFVEGMNWLVVFVYGCTGFALSLVCAVVWATVRGDVQGGFAIAAFMIAFLLFCGGVLRSEIT
ncbi:hypothetical protein B0T17DRAFT_504403 [Bombardia bombarda]|uniref:Uncharacterized protein n=1 Tax=Bombardia bombarda TaxID=252184 RepID=A0AA39XMZ6_9PEZI|nr:hypothetical protein B0T17DRAFT_504403 [Bombardia bombarda]